MSKSRSPQTPDLCFTGSVVDIQAPAEDIRIISVKATEPYTYEAGQYLFASVGDLPPRPYSIASAPTDAGESFELHIKKGYGAASHYIMTGLKSGDTVRFSRPAGNHVHKDNHERNILFIAGGLGIAPHKAIIEKALAAGQTAPVTLYWGTQVKSDMYLASYFETLAQKYKNFNFIPVTDKPVGIAVSETAPDLSGFDVYLSGPPAMIKDLLPRLTARHAKPDQIYYDDYNMNIDRDRT